MRLLVITQKISLNDPVLGFFHRWVEELAQKFEQITVICLEKGVNQLPANVNVLSLGKEEKQSRLQYLQRFFTYVWRERKEYDAVFVHMNQEYILLAGWFWWLTCKKIYLWRNHHAGNWLTNLAVLWCNKVFCTSKYSYTAQFKKTVLMPVGIDTEWFKPDSVVTKIPASILFLSRMAPVKRPDLLIQTLKQLAATGENFVAHFYGDPLPQDVAYYENLKTEAGRNVSFHLGVPNHQTAKIYNEHTICVNLSSSGMYDKTIFEAAACGVLSLSSNKNLEGQFDGRLLFTEGSLQSLFSALKILLSLPENERQLLAEKSRQYVIANHSLVSLGEKLFHAIAD